MIKILLNETFNVMIYLLEDTFMACTKKTAPAVKKAAPAKTKAADKNSAEKIAKLTS